MLKNLSVHSLLLNECIVMPLSRWLRLLDCVSLSLNFIPNREAFCLGLPWSAFFDSNICGLVIIPKARALVHSFEAYNRPEES